MDRQYSMWTMMMRSSPSSWEERAFAEDAVGGSCVWPPRSYTCSFCKREFRSAQALGGHMNVHRRDRARLKLQSSSQSNDHEELIVPPHRQNFLQNPTKSSEVVPTSIPRVLDNRNSYILDEFVAAPGGLDHGGVETKLCVGSSSTSVLCQNQKAATRRADGDQEVNISCAKRPKITVATLQFVVSKAKSMEELDLELRLGSDRPKVHMGPAGGPGLVCMRSQFLSEGFNYGNEWMNIF